MTHKKKDQKKAFSYDERQMSFKLRVHNLTKSA